MCSPRDGNFIPTLRATLNTDGKTIVNLEADSSTHALFVSNGNTGSDFGTKNAQRDKDHTPVMIAVSSSDLKTVVELYADSLGNLLVDST